MKILTYHRLLALTVPVIFLAACITNETEPDEDAVAYQEPMDPNEVICKRQRPIGSHIPVRICRTRAQIEADREAALRATGPLRTMGGRPGPAAPPPPPTPSPP